MKIKVYSQTGKPTDIEAAKAYEKDFKKRYDELWEKRQSGEITIDEMRLSLDSVDKELREKHPMFIEYDLPKSGKKWKEFIMSFGCPVTIAITEEDKKLALFLMDSQYS